MARIEGIIRTISPIHQTQPTVQGYVDWREGDRTLRLVYTDARKGRCQVQMSDAIFTPEGRRLEIPIVSGNSLRGLLRRKAARHLLTAMNQKIRPELFQVISVGAYHRKDMGGELSADLLTMARNNAFVGLFGGGGSSIASGYSVGDLRPVTFETQHLMPGWVGDQALPGYVPEPDSASGEEGKRIPPTLTRIYPTIRRDPMLQGEGVEFVHDHDKVFAERMLEMIATSKTRKAAKAADADADARAAADSESVINMAMMSYVQAIVPGVPMYCGLNFRSWATPEHIGLMLLALQDLVNDQAMGGASRRGFGRFKPDLRLYADGIDGSAPVFAPRQGDEAEYRLSDEAEVYAQSARDALPLITVAELEDLYITTLSKAKEAA